eukprot:CAMPEP_0116914264 /NCGR_PEP_ID=MMETSP0467-20121206/17223_1 /TAXON_ID=283647 /ORGANISM="Mesodinium pulex, Strain SPMC105" /LENGTH=32 /DNA_ID= /DNA_START= /DNA_END= /DNA_ORIENTATION=
MAHNACLAPSGPPNTTSEQRSEGAAGTGVGAV